MKHILPTKNNLRIRRHMRVRSQIAGTAERPRLTVFRSNRFISAQIIDDEIGKTIVSAHGRESGGAQMVQAKVVGSSIAKRAKKAGIDMIVFDRSGYQYAGQIKTLAEAVRAEGITF